MQLLAGQHLSLRADKQRSLRIDRDDLVPSILCSSAVSQYFIQAFPLQFYGHGYFRDGRLSESSSIFSLSAFKATGTTAHA